MRASSRGSPPPPHPPPSASTPVAVADIIAPCVASGGSSWIGEFYSEGVGSVVGGVLTNSARPVVGVHADGPSPVAALTAHHAVQWSTAATLSPFFLTASPSSSRAPNHTDRIYSPEGSMQPTTFSNVLYNPAITSKLALCRAPGSVVLFVSISKARPAPFATLHSKAFIGSRLDVLTLRVFGCVTYSHTAKELPNTKVTPKARVSSMVGYDANTKACLLDNGTEVIGRCSITFSESIPYVDQSVKLISDLRTLYRSPIVALDPIAAISAPLPVIDPPGSPTPIDINFDNAPASNSGGWRSTAQSSPTLDLGEQWSYDPDGTDSVGAIGMLILLDEFDGGAKSGDKFQDVLSTPA
ncbi:hypothetical protein BDK51DRAFT_51211, partial [Blyttiomyces helicus]